MLQHGSARVIRVRMDERARQLQAGELQVQNAHVHKPASWPSGHCCVRYIGETTMIDLGCTLVTMDIRMPPRDSAPRACCRRLKRASAGIHTPHRFTHDAAGRTLAGGLSIDGKGR